MPMLLMKVIASLVREKLCQGSTGGELVTVGSHKMHTKSGVPIDAIYSQTRLENMLSTT